MDGNRLHVSSEVFLKRMTISECHNRNGPDYSLFSENVNGEAPASAPDTSLPIQMLRINADLSTEVYRVSDLGNEGDNISCISKADGTHLEIGGHNGDTHQRNVTGSSASVNSFCKKGLEKPIDTQSVKHDSVSSECIAEQGNTLRCSQYAREILHSVVDISDRLDPSETSSFRDEHSGTASPKVESNSSAARGTDLLTNSQKCGHECIDHLKTDTEIDGNQRSAVALNKLDQKKHLEMRMTYDLQEPSLQYCDIEDNEDSDELVDVRVCDICGDVGRECLLAICSRCSDGAEHIYCIRVKMDKVPEGDWICEECKAVAEAQTQKAEEQKVSGSLQKSSTNEMAQSSRKLNLSGYAGRVRVAHALASSGKRRGAIIEMSPSTKKRVLDNDLRLRSPPGSDAKRVLPRHANLKIVAKAEVASSSVSKSTGNVLWKACQPSASKSSVIESQFYRGSLSKKKFTNSADLKTGRESEDVYREQKGAKGSQIFGAGPQHALTKLRKSKSFTASNVARLDTSDSKKNMYNNFKIPKPGSMRNITQRSYSFNSKISQPVSPLGGSGTSRVKPVKGTPAPVVVKQQVAQTAKVCRDLERGTIHRVAKRQCVRNGSAGLDKKMPCSAADQGRNPGNFGRSSPGCLERKVERQSANMETGPISKDAKFNLTDTGKVQVDRSPSGETVLLAVSAHPDVERVWRGIFNVKDCNKLPICCSGLQAHLSACASPKAYEVVNKFPCEITVKEVLQQDIWPAQFTENCATEDNIALYFFAEDLESYRSYKKFLNCMVLNNLALKSNLDGVELLIFPSQALPARSQRWNNLFFLWGVFRAKRLSFSDDICVPSPCDAIQIHTSDTITSSQHPHMPIPPISEPRNSNISTQVCPGSVAADPLLGSVQGSGSSSEGELQSSVSTKSKCMERTAGEVDVKTVAPTLMEKEQHATELQTADKAQEENRSQNKDSQAKIANKSCPCVPSAEISAEPTVGFECTKEIGFATEEKHHSDIAFNSPTCNERSSEIDAPLHTNGLQVHDEMNGRSISLNSSPSEKVIDHQALNLEMEVGSISLNSGPSDSGGTETPDKLTNHQDLTLDLAMWSEPKPVNEGDLDLDLGLPNHNAGHGHAEPDDLISLDLSLGLPSTDNGPVPMMEELLPEKDDVDTSLFLFRGGKTA